MLKPTLDSLAAMKVRDGMVLLSAAFLALISVVDIARYVKFGRLNAEDDAYYYLILARNITENHLSTFDGQSLTNGYHPLWLAFLIVEHLIFGQSVMAMWLTEVLLITASLYILLKLIPDESLATGALFTLVYGITVNSFALKGMETSILVFFLSLLIGCIAPVGAGRLPKAGTVGVLASACIGARLDAAVFVIPLTILGLPAFRPRVVALSVVGALGVGYVLVNLIVFGTALPISGNVKSLGGMQVNTAFLSQFTSIWQKESSLVQAAHETLTSPFVQIFILLIGSPVILLLGKRNSIGRKLTISFMVGSFLYFVKILFFSSWKIWAWYAFPVIFGVLGYMLTILPLLHSWDKRHARASRAAAWLAATLVCADVFVRPLLASSGERGFHLINELAARHFAPVLRGARVAMGDRAGSFAFAYDGPVVQLEGLVNDVEYFRVLSSRGDLKPLLCSRGVKFVLDFEVDLGSYQDHEIKVFRPWVTTFAGPTLKVSAADEVGRVHDLSKFDNRKRNEGDVYLYLWRLAGC